MAGHQLDNSDSTDRPAAVSTFPEPPNDLATQEDVHDVDETDIPMVFLHGNGVMARNVTRRRVLEFAGHTALGLATTSLVGRLCAAEQAVSQEVKSRLRVTCRDTMLKYTGQPDCWSAMKQTGAEGIEALIDEELALPRLYHPTEKYSVATGESIRRLATDLNIAGMRITAWCMCNRYSERSDFEIAWCKRVAEAAKALGVPAIRIVLPWRIEGSTFLRFAIELMKKLLAATEATGVAFAIENHGFMTNDPEFLEPLFEQVDSSRLGLTLDTANFYSFGYPLPKVYAIYEQFASRVKHTHCKSIAYPATERQKRRPTNWHYNEFACPLDRGDIDFRRVVGILTKAGYANDLCVENESLGKRSADECAHILAKEIELLKHVQ